MVSKLVVGLQAQTLRVDAAANPELAEALYNRYRRVLGGLGYLKSVDRQGGFPTDPHSHTPAHSGARQPGMTGQVKEGVLIRFTELGVVVDGGALRFEPRLLDVAEFLKNPQSWAALGDGGELPSGSLGFLYCGVPIVYHLTTAGSEQWVKLVSLDDGVTAISGCTLDHATSRDVLRRTGTVTRIDVGVPRSQLLG